MIEDDTLSSMWARRSSLTMTVRTAVDPGLVADESVQSWCRCARTRPMSETKHVNGYSMNDRQSAWANSSVSSSIVRRAALHYSLGRRMSHAFVAREDYRKFCSGYKALTSITTNGTLLRTERVGKDSRACPDCTTSAFH